MKHIIRRMDWKQLPITIPLVNGDTATLTINRMRRINDLQGILRQLEEYRGENND